MGDTDMGSEAGGCKRSAIKQPFPRDKLKDMMERSMANPVSPAYPKSQAALYNEVVINTTHYVQELPYSVLAIAYFNDSFHDIRYGDTRLADKIVAANTYVQMLDTYHMKETDLPLLQINREDGVIMDVSSGARKFAKTHTVKKYRENHPFRRLPMNPAKFAGAVREHVVASQQQSSKGQPKGSPVDR